MKTYKYVKSYVDRHGRLRNYFRLPSGCQALTPVPAAATADKTKARQRHDPIPAARRGHSYIALPAEIGSPAFVTAYQTIFASLAPPPKKNRQQRIADALSGLIDAFEYVLSGKPRAIDYAARDQAIAVLRELTEGTSANDTVSNGSGTSV